MDQKMGRYKISKEQFIRKSETVDSSVENNDEKNAIEREHLKTLISKVLSKKIVVKKNYVLELLVGLFVFK